MLAGSSALGFLNLSRKEKPKLITIITIGKTLSKNLAATSY